jgi:ribosomal-protein-alanine N-acetyltransferase
MGSLRAGCLVTLPMLESQRLYIFPLSFEYLLIYLEAEDKFEKLIGLTLTGRTVAPRVYDDIHRDVLPKMGQATGDNYLFHTFWLAIEKTSKLIVAELGFKGQPNKQGEIEIGYGTLPVMRGRGFMTEAVGLMIEWSRSRKEVQYMLAETDGANLPSVRVMQKNNFIQFRKKGSMLWWKIEVK